MKSFFLVDFNLNIIFKVDFFIKYWIYHKFEKLVFKQRNDAFDFYTTLCDFKEKLQFEKKSKTEEYKPKYDFSLKTENKPVEEKKPVNLNR